MSRTQAEIAARLAARGDDDVFGFRAEVLIEQLDYERARPHLKPDVTAEWWEANTDRRPVADQAAAYLEFAWGKARDHRGISAGRSVEKLTEYAWLLERTDVMDAMEAADYAQYGVPKLVAFANGFGLAVPDGTDLARMAEGEPCEPGCESGCGA